MKINNNNEKFADVKYFVFNIYLCQKETELK